MITRERIQHKLTDYLNHSGMTQKELASRLGISQQTVSHYACGNKVPTLEVFANLCAIIDADANDILCVDEYKKNSDNNRLK